MTNFVNIREALQSLAIDPSTADEPTRRKFIFDGAHLSANIATAGQAGNALHTQSAHDEVVVVLTGKPSFGWATRPKSFRPATWCSYRRTRFMVAFARSVRHGPRYLSMPRTSIDRGRILNGREYREANCMY